MKLVERLMIVVLPFVFLTGCSEPKVNLVPASGTITIKGKPAENISIQFLPIVPEDAGVKAPTSSAVSQADGTFELRTTATNEVGAVPGSHYVVLADMDEERPAQGEARTKPIRLSSDYVVAGKLTVVVQEGKPIELKIP